MKSFLGPIAALAACAFISGCGGNCPPCGGGKGVAAVVAGETITMEELNDAAKDRLARIDTEIYRTKRKVLDDLIEEKLVAAAAQRENMSVEEYVAKEVGSKAEKPTEEEVRALYDTRKGAINKPFEEVRGQIEAFLVMNRAAHAQTELMAKLREGAEVRVELSPPRVEIAIGDVPTIGEEDAEVTLIEFSDYQCPFCKRARPTIWRLVDEYKGKLKYVFLDFPLSFHRDAKKAHEAARCAGDQGKYYEYNRKVFENQAKMGVGDLKKYAKQLNLDMDQFNNCLDSSKYASAVEEMMAKGARAGVSGTPAFFINGIMLSGAQPYEAFKEIIDAELER